MTHDPSLSYLNGHVLVVASGGACPGVDSIVRAALTCVSGARQRDGTPTKLLTPRGGLGRLALGDHTCLTEVTAGALSPPSLTEPPIISFCKGGPGRTPDDHDRLVRLLLRLRIGTLLVWGGQFSLANLANTAAAAARVGAVEGMQLRVGGLVKSIDDDASIPPGYHSIGFSSASAALARTLKNLMRDARQSDTLIHVPVLSGNQVGCLTEAAARGAGCPLYIIPERLPKRCSLQLVLETIFGAWLKGAIRDQPSYHLVVPIAEGILGSLDPASCPGLKEARDRYREGVTANHFPLPTIIQDQLGAMFAELSLPHGIKVSVRSAYHGYAARGSEANSTDREMASLHVTTALRAMAQGESGRVYYGSGQHCHSLVLTGLLTEDGQGRERQVDLKDPVIAAHWNAIRPHRLTSEDLSHEQLARIAAFLQLPTKDVQDRFDLVAGIAN